MKTEVKHALKNTSILLKKWTRMSLRNRIALYYTIATAILVALVFTILFFMVERMVYKQFDDEVNNEVTEVFTDAHVTSHDFTSFSRFKHCIDDKEINSMGYFRINLIRFLFTFTSRSTPLLRQ